MHIQRLVLISLTIFVATIDGSLSSREDIEAHLGSKTPYRVIANKNDKEIKYPGCTPNRIWAIIRHGTRNPSRKFIHVAQNRLTKLRDKIVSTAQSQLSRQQIEALKKWSVNINPDEEKFLLPEGEDELIELAERMQNRFPKLLVDNYDPIHYTFKYTATERTKKSAESFAVGLFERHNIRQVQYPEPLHKDPVLRFYKLCNRWRSEVDKNPDAQVEVKKFAESDEMNKAMEKIMKKAGISGLTTSDVHEIYMACAFETAWNKYQLSPWCALFDKQSIRTLEYLKELQHYYVDGYGHELTTKIACPAVIDMLDHINPKSAQSNATFYFTHSGTILKILAHLHLYQDDFILTHEDFQRKRQWRISKIDAFASNIAFITFHHHHRGPVTRRRALGFDCKSETKVLTMHQERIVHLPGCPAGEDLCSYDKFRHILKDSVEHCEFQEICKL